MFCRFSDVDIYLPMSVTQLAAKQTPLLSSEVKKYLGKVSWKSILKC